jgi:acetyl/propionyl-CoA carboxylase alpha subunit
MPKTRIRGFLPSIGRLSRCHTGPKPARTRQGPRLRHHPHRYRRLRKAAEISACIYDPMIAKLDHLGVRPAPRRSPRRPTRSTPIYIDGIQHNIPFPGQAVMQHDRFKDLAGNDLDRLHCKEEYPGRLPAARRRSARRTPRCAGVRRGRHRSTSRTAAAREQLIDGQTVRSTAASLWHQTRVVKISMASRCRWKSPAKAGSSFAVFIDGRDLIARGETGWIVVRLDPRRSHLAPSR